MKTHQAVKKETRQKRSTRLRAMGPVGLALFLGGCATGPHFKTPPLPHASGYTASPLPASTVASSTALGDAQRFAEGAPIASQWWQAFDSPKLNALVEQALKDSPTREAAEATLRQARHAYAARAGSTQYPQVNAHLGGGRKTVNGAAMGLPDGEKTFNLFNASVDVQYHFDLFGANRRALEALAAQAEYQRFQLEGAHLSLVANVVGTAIAQAQLAAQIATAEHLLAVQTEQLNLTRERVTLGAALPEEVLALQTQREQTRVAMLALRNRLDQATHLLAALSGQTPAATGLPQFVLADFTLPTDLPLRVPSELVRRRPDIRAAEALLCAANAQYGVAVAKQYPQISLGAEVGSQALSMDQLFDAGSLIWGLAAQLTKPLFDRGLRAEARAAEAGFDAAAAHYRETILQAFRSVADVLRALDHDAQALAAHAASDAAAQEALELVRRRYVLGGASYLEWVVAQQQAESTRMDLFAAQTQRLMDTVTFYTAMGGGWIHDEGPIEKEPTRAPVTK